MVAKSFYCYATTPSIGFMVRLNPFPTKPETNNCKNRKSSRTTSIYYYTTEENRERQGNNTGVQIIKLISTNSKEFFVDASIASYASWAGDFIASIYYAEYIHFGIHRVFKRSILVRL